MLSAAIARQAPVAAPARARLHGLTGVRFLAAAWVFAYHFFPLTVDGAPWWLRRAQDAGHAAVSLFFVLSGFVLAYNYAAPLGDGRVGRARFWWLRGARVWPLYALVTLVEVPLALHAGVTPGAVAQATAGDLVGLQAWWPRITFVGNTPGWSVSVELFFYAAFPLVAPLVARRPRAAMAASFALALACAASPALVAPHGAAATFLKCGPLLRLPEFIVGVALGHLFVRRSGPRPAPLVGLAGVALVVAVVLGTGGVPRYVVHALLLPGFALVLWSVAAGRARLVGTAPLVLLGEASYGLYLLQIPLFQVLGGKYEWPLPALLGFFALLVATSIATHFAIERPAQRWLRARAPR